MNITIPQLIKLGTVYHHIAYPETQPEYNTSAYWKTKEAFGNWRKISARLREFGYTWEPKIRTYRHTL